MCVCVKLLYIYLLKFIKKFKTSYLRANVLYIFLFASYLFVCLFVLMNQNFLDCPRFRLVSIFDRSQIFCCCEFEIQ